MPASLHDWVDRLKSQPLPAMASTVQRVSALMARPSSNHTDYQRIIARDPGFALSIFSYLSDLPRPPREPITTLTHALALSGTAPLEACVAQIPVINQHSDTEYSRGLLFCYSRAVHAAVYLSRWSDIRKDSNLEELMQAALLRECGEMALWCAAPEQMAMLESRVVQGLSRDNASLAVLGFNLTQLSLRLAHAWGLPPLIGDSLAPDGAFRSRSLGVMLASELAHSSTVSWGSDQTMELIDLAADYCRQTTDQAAAALHSLCAETARQLHQLDLPVAAALLLHIEPRPEAAAAGAGEQEKQRTESVDPSTTPATQPEVPAPPATKSAAQKVQLPEQPGVDSELAVEAEAGSETHQKQKIAAETPSITPESELDGGHPHPQPARKPAGDKLQTRLTRVMKQLRDNAGLERAMFAMMAPDSKSLRARFIIGAEKGAGIKTFQVSLDKRHLFSVLMAKPQSFWLNNDNRKKYLSAIPPYLHKALNTEGFFVSSLFVGNKPVGILYADSSTGKLNSGSFTYFKQLALQLSTELSGTVKAEAAGSFTAKG